ncbi:helicase POLQ-like [Ctenocephalides felis]|uniref:helicase POLQ-like n=1 Tax=Ctenocephalides felis TaxID=7515 RepID=UPI000E6E47C7|nr:helicase POLQ-like [Ctenocephalides felis]
MMKKVQKQPNTECLISNSNNIENTYTNGILNCLENVNESKTCAKRKTNTDTNSSKSLPKRPKFLILDMSISDPPKENVKNECEKSNVGCKPDTKSEGSKITDSTKRFLMDLYCNKQDKKIYINSPDLFADTKLLEDKDYHSSKVTDEKVFVSKGSKTLITNQYNNTFNKNCNSPKISVNQKNKEAEDNFDFEMSQLFKTSQLDKISFLQPTAQNNSKNNIIKHPPDSNYTQLLMSTQINKLLDNNNTMHKDSISHNTAKLKNINRKSITSSPYLKKNPDLFDESQIFKTDELETIIINAEKSSRDTNIEDNAKEPEDNETQLNDFIGPQNLIDLQKKMMIANEINVSLEDAVLNQELLNVTESSQYKKDIHTLFNICEMSICNNNFHEIKNEDSNETLGLAAIQGINWENDSMMAKESVLKEESSIKKTAYDTIKQTLLKNAANTVETTREFLKPNTISNNKRIFTSKGPFYDLPFKCKELIFDYKNISQLYDWQDECLKLPAIQQRKNLIYALPTSGGKTLVAEILILREVLCSKKNVIFILPFVSIVQEKIWALSPFAVGMEFLVEEYAGGKGTCPPRKRRHKNSVYIATIEKSLSLINSLIEIGRLGEIGLVVVDELHLLGEVGRGATLEIVLTKLISTKYDIQIVGMSATIGNISEIAQFLSADVYTRDFRPVELKEYAKCGSDIMALATKPKSADEIFTFHRSCKYNYYTDMQLKMDPDCIAGLALEILPESSCLIFCPTKKNCENVASLICKIFPKSLLEYRKLDKKGLCEMIKKDCGTLCPILSNTLLYGVAYHHSGLTSDERKHLEDAYRAGVISVICCTSTLAAGVNLPAKRVILRSPYVGKEFITLSRYKQMVGRAGRAGFKENGESILIFAPKDKIRVQNLLFAPMDDALSSLHYYNGEGVKSLILSSVGLNVAKSRSELCVLMGQTLMAVQAKRLEINVKQITNKTISSLFKLGALTTENEVKKVMQMTMENSILFSQTQTENKDLDKSKKCLVIGRNTTLVISKLGKAAARACINLKRAHMLYNDLLQAQSGLVLLDCLHLLYLITPYEQSEQIKPNMPAYYSIYTKLGTKELETAKILGINEACAIKMLLGKQIKNVPMRILNRFYVTLMLYDLWNHEAVHDIADKFHVPRGVVQSLMTSAASFSSSVLRFCEELEEFWAFKDLLTNFTLRLQHCCTLELLPLMDLPNVKLARAKQLYNAGYKTLHLIAKTTPSRLVQDIEHLNKKVATQLIATAKLLLLEKVETLREEAEDVLEGLWNA